MKEIFKALSILGVVALLIAPTEVYAGTYVNGYTKRDGTYVQGHYRSSPNSKRYDNYSSRGNTNPYTGKKGTKRNEFSSPPKYNKSYGLGY